MRYIKRSVKVRKSESMPDLKFVIAYAKAAVGVCFAKQIRVGGVSNSRLFLLRVKLGTWGRTKNEGGISHFECLTRVVKLDAPAPTRVLYAYTPPASGKTTAAGLYRLSRYLLLRSCPPILVAWLNRRRSWPDYCIATCNWNRWSH